MATIIRLSQDQIDHLLEEGEKMETALKELHEELASLQVPGDTLKRYERLHDRFSSTLGFLRRQRELGTREDGASS